MRAAAAWSGPAAFASVFLTHLHSDHTTDLNDIVTMRWVASQEPDPLPVVGPPGTQRLAPAAGSEPEWEAEAQSGFDGSVVVAHDLWQLDL